MSVVTLSSQLSFNFSEQVPTGYIAGQPIPVVDAIRLAFRTSGVLADQVDGVYAARLTFVASTPQTLDLQGVAFVDVLGNAITVARARFLYYRWTNVVDNLPMKVGNNVTNEFNGYITATGIHKVFPSTTLNDGAFLMTAPQTTGIPITSSSKVIKFDPGTAAGVLIVVIAGCSS